MRSRFSAAGGNGLLADVVGLLRGEVGKGTCPAGSAHAAGGHAFVDFLVFAAGGNGLLVNVCGLLYCGEMAYLRLLQF